MSRMVVQKHLPVAKGPLGRWAGCAPAVPLAHSVTLGQAQTLPRPPFPHPEQGVTVTPQAVLCS